MLFDKLFESCLQEMAATYKDAGTVKQSISDIKSKNLPHHYQKPLVAIANDADRDEMVDKIINKVFGLKNFNPDINTKKELQDALEKAVIEVSKEPDSKFLRPVVGVSANYLGRWLGTNINVEYSRSGAKELETKGVSTLAAKEILNKTLTPTTQEREEIKQEEQPTEEKPAIQSGSSSEDNPLNKEYSFEEAAFDRFKETVEKANKRNARYGIPAVQIEELGEEFVDVKERAAGTRFFNDILTSTLPARRIRKVKFKLSVPELKMSGGWEFIGRVDHEAIGNLIVSVPGTEHGVDLHKMFGNSEPSYCDHCNTTRRRTSTFVLKNPEGKIKRVGRQCLKDYLPGGERNVSEVIAYAQYLSDIAERLRIWESQSGGGDSDEERMGGGSSSVNHFNAEGIVGMTISIVKIMGYMSKSQANKLTEQGEYVQSTADVIDMMYNDLDAVKKNPKIKDVFADLKENNEKYKEEAKKIIDWADTYLDKQLEDQYNKMREYYQNLSTIIKGIKKSSDAHIPKKYLGYLISIVPLYNKHVDSEKADARLKEQGERGSEYVGYIGMPIGELNAADKRKFKEHNNKFPSSPIKIDEFPFNGPIEVTVNSARTFQRQSYSYYDSGVSYMYSMTDDNGNVYVYFASNDMDFNEGDKAKIVKATVKNHKDYTTKSGKTIKQTYLTRVKFD